MKKFLLAGLIFFSMTGFTMAQGRRPVHHPHHGHHHHHHAVHHPVHHPGHH